MRTDFFTEIGTNVEGTATAEEAIIQGKLDWTVEIQPLIASLTLRDDEGEPSALLKPVEYKFAAYRGDTNDILGLVGTNYKIIQNKKSFSVMDDIASTTQAKYVSVGMEGVGAKIFMVALLPGDLQIVGTDDTCKKYLKLTSSHDGKSSLSMGFTPIHGLSRAVLSLSRKGLQDKVSVRHTSSNERRLSEAVRILQMADNYFGELENVFTGLAKVPFTSDMLDKMLDTILPVDLESSKKARTENKRIKLQEVYNNSVNIVPEAKGTAWAAFLACCEYSDFTRTFSAKEGRASVAENRFKSISEGTSYDFKNLAFNSIADLAGI